MKAAKIKKPEFMPDAWAIFERAIKAVVKSPPQHRTKPKPKKKKSPAKGVSKKSKQ